MLSVIWLWIDSSLSWKSKFKAQKHNFNGPTRGVKLSEENKREFTEEQLEAGKNIIGLQGKFIDYVKINFIIILTVLINWKAGYNKGATMSGTIIGNTRHM